MGIHQKPGLAHLVFLNLQDLAERVHLPAHVLHHLVDSVHANFALLITLQGEADGHVLSSFHEQRCIRLFLGHVRGQAFEQLLQVELGVGVGLAQFFLQDRSLGFVFADLSETGEQANCLNDFFLR